MNGSGPTAVSLEGGQGLNQFGGSTAEPSLEQNESNFPRTCSGIGSETCSRIGSETGSRTGPKPVPSSNSARMETKFVNPRPWKHQSSHPLDQILSNINTGVQIRSKLKNYCAFYDFLSIIEPKNVNEALANSDWVTAMQEEFHQFERNKVWHLVPQPEDRTIIGAKWVFRNKLDELEQSLGTRPGWWSKATTKKNELIMKKPLHLLQGLRRSVF